jgi:iron complex outermembrane receptor protein
LLAIVAALGSAAVTAEETGEVTAVENIVVTARYKTENLQETPLTISAYGETDLQKATALDLRDIGPPTPNMHIQPVVTFRNSAAVHIRGIGGQGIESTEESRVGISLNGVFIARPVATLLDLFDTEMIEVLRGRKGTTFGKNSLGGGVSVTTKKPSGQFGAQTEITMGDYGRQDYRAAVEFPVLEDKLSVRLSGIAQNFDGYYDNISTHRHGDSHLQSEDLNSGRVTVRFTPNDKWESLFIASVLDEKRHLRGWRCNERSDADHVRSRIPLVQRREPRAQPHSGLRVCGVEQGPVQNHARRAARRQHASDELHADQQRRVRPVHADDGQRQHRDRRLLLQRLRPDRSTVLPDVPRAGPLAVEQRDPAAHELRGRNDGLEKFDIVTGVYLFDQHHKIVQSFPTLGSPSSADYTHQTNTQRAAFGQVIYEITSRAHASFGIRYTDEQKEFKRNPGILCGNPQVPNGCERILPYNKATVPSITFMSGQPKPLSDDLHNNNSSIRVGVDYQFTDQIFGYALYSQGYHGGEYGARASSELTMGPTKDEDADNYEIGVKSEWFDSRLRVNIAAFEAGVQKPRVRRVSSPHPTTRPVRRPRTRTLAKRRRTAPRSRPRGFRSTTSR